MVYISAAKSIRVSSTTFTQSVQKATGVGKIKQPLGLLRRSGSFKVIEFGTNRKPICDFLLVINSNLPPILHRFQDIASQTSKSLHFSNTLWFNPQTEGFPWDDLRKILPACRQVTSVLRGAETLQKISIGWVHKLYSRQTTDGRTTTYSEHEHEFTLAKNEKLAKRGRGLGHVTYFSNFFRTPNISGMAKDTNLKFCMLIEGNRY